MKIAIIGWEDSVSKVYDIANEAYSDIEFLPVLINNTDDSHEVVSRYEEKADGIIFTGLGFAKIVAKFHNPKIPYVYISRDGTSIMKAFWNMNKRGINASRISLDIVDKGLVDDICRDFDMEFKEIYVFPFEKHKKEKIYKEEHKRLWKDKKIDLVITSYGWIYNELKNQGIPVLRLGITHHLIRNSIDHIIYKIKNRSIKKSQIATQIVEIDSKEKSDDKYRYDILRKSSLLESKLIDYISIIQGIPFSNKVGHLQIISTRGAIENQSSQKQFVDILNQLKKEKVTVYSGVGFGNTAYDADFNARTALNKSYELGETAYFIVDDERNINGPLGNKETIQYKSLIINKNINNISKETGISTTYLSKIAFLLKNSNIEYVDSKALGELLGITDRSARRILKKLVDTGYGELITSIQTNSVGRPLNMFKLNIL
ncbi:hypothetical protein ACOAKC_12065 [Hathewaya histolytica]|uniref:hypothetical protein n=1 Tax=Hathewaya histolytica TaxID=1498 RepID=UPI003B66FEC2